MVTKKTENEVDKYIAGFDPEIQDRLKEMRKTILDEMPDAEEKIGYGLPTYKLDGKNIVHFGGFKQHTGFYPTPSGLTAFEKELAKYKASKGSIQFPHTAPLPLPLVRKIVKFRLKEHKQDMAAKKKKS